MKLLSGSISKPATVIPEPLIQSVKLSSPGQIELTVYGPPGEPFMLQSSNDGMTWQDHSVANLTSEFTTIVIPAGPSNSASLFRLEWIWP